MKNTININNIIIIDEKYNKIINYNNLSIINYKLINK